MRLSPISSPLHPPTTPAMENEMATLLFLSVFHKGLLNIHISPSLSFFPFLTHSYTSFPIFHTPPPPSHASHTSPSLTHITPPHPSHTSHLLPHTHTPPTGTMSGGGNKVMKGRMSSTIHSDVSPGQLEEIEKKLEADEKALQVSPHLLKY